MVLGALGGAATCGAVLAMFVGALRDQTAASLLFALFGLRRMRPLRIVAFTVEMLLAATAIRAKAAQGRQSAVEDAGGEALEPQQGDDAQIDGGDGP